MNRTLALKKDTLTELASDDLSAVVGGSAGTCYTCVECLVGKTTGLVSDFDIPSLQSPCNGN